ncbi:MAG: ATP-binding cassette domain-containing protein, partial [Cyclobacteriaceae bacterium]|nr:ATP-binding cassette domain-containing protein [Cyclobacteriaceae bacterium]
MKHIEAIDVNAYYGDNHVLKNINLAVKENTVTAFIGPSGCGKSTFLRTLNRMNDYIDIFRLEGKILVEGNDIYKKKVNIEEL